MSQFKIKVCGVTQIEDAQLLIDHHVDAIGLNFYAQSPRSVELERAAEICRWLDRRLTTVGVFVDQSPVEIKQIADALDLDIIQLHGDQTPDQICQFQREVMPAIRLKDFVGDRERAVGFALEKIVPWIEAGVKRVLVDAFVSGVYGGSGKRIDGTIVRQLNLPIPVVLAGGLDPDNVGEAIRTSQCQAVDVASGVESVAGQKDSKRVARFAAEALRLLDGERGNGPSG